MPEQSHTFACPAGLRLIGATPALWVESPRTGRRITIVNGWWHELPGRLAARVVRAAGTGVRTVAFTRDELAALKALADRVNARCRPPRGTPFARRASQSFDGSRRLPSCH